MKWRTNASKWVNNTGSTHILDGEGFRALVTATRRMVGKPGRRYYDVDYRVFVQHGQSEPFRTTSGSLASAKKAVMEHIGEVHAECR